MITAKYQDKLPHNYAQKIIELESLLDQNCSMDLITDLNELYRIGIDYYVRFQPRKAQHFQKKMTRLLADPVTLKLIENKSPSKCNIMSSQMATKSKIKEQINKFANCSGEYVKNILEKSEKAFQRGQALVQTDLNKQQQLLKNRIMLKKVKSQEKLFKMNFVSHK